MAEVRLRGPVVQDVENAQSGTGVQDGGGDGIEVTNVERTTLEGPGFPGSHETDEPETVTGEAARRVEPVDGVGEGREGVAEDESDDADSRNAGSDVVDEGHGVEGRPHGGLGLAHYFPFE